MNSKRAPKVSVVTSTYNWSSALREAMKTVLAQSFSDFEYLVIGDCCTDKTEQVVAEFDDPRIRWHNLSSNTGNQSGVNKIALEMARGKYIAYLNHDDLWFENHLEDLVHTLEKHQLDLVSAVALSISPPGCSHRQLIGLPRLHNGDGTTEVTAMTSSILHTRRAGEEAGGWIDWRETHKIPTLDFFRRIRELRGAFAVLNEITSLKFHSGNRKNCYQEKLAVEQPHFSQLMIEDPVFRYREAMKALAFDRMRVKPPIIPIAERPDDAPKGWQIERKRMNRGLMPMLGEEEIPQVAELLPEETSPVVVESNDLAVILNRPATQPPEKLTDEPRPCLLKRLRNRLPRICS